MRIAFKTRFWSDDGRVQGVEELFLNDELARASSTAEAVALGHSVLLVHALATAEECELLVSSLHQLISVF